MNAELVKATCAQVADDLGGHKVAAAYAGVSVSRWSDYCNLAEPETTIPLHRALLIRERTGRPYFADLFRETDPPAIAADPHRLAAETLNHVAKTIADLTEALADDVITPAERRVLLADIGRLKTSVLDLEARIGAGDPALKAV
jgi:uncharacterized protein (UPF0248 family)